MLAIRKFRPVHLNARVPEIGDGVKIKLTKKEVEPLLRMLSGTGGKVTRVESASDGVLRYSVWITIKDEGGIFPVVQLRTVFFPDGVGLVDSVHRSPRSGPASFIPVLRPLEGETEDRSRQKLKKKKRPVPYNPERFAVVGEL